MEEDEEEDEDGNPLGLVGFSNLVELNNSAEDEDCSSCFGVEDAPPKRPKNDIVTLIERGALLMDRSRDCKRSEIGR